MSSEINVFLFFQNATPTSPESRGLLPLISQDLHFQALFQVFFHVLSAALPSSEVRSCDLSTRDRISTGGPGEIWPQRVSMPHDFSPEVPLGYPSLAVRSIPWFPIRRFLPIEHSIWTRDISAESRGTSPRFELLGPILQPHHVIQLPLRRMMTLCHHGLSPLRSTSS
jgi:hypothetical protein